MHVRRKATLHVAVIEAAVVDDPRLSAAALGLYAALSAAPAGCDADALCERFSLTEGELHELLAELHQAGHLSDGDAPRPMPPPRRQKRPYRKPWLPATAKVLLRTIADKADADGCVSTANRQLAAETGQAQTTVNRNLRILEGKGLLRRAIVRSGDHGHVRLIWVRDGHQDGASAGETLQ